MPDGAYSEVPAWRSREAWLEWVVELLQSPRGVELCRGRIKADTVLVVARVEAESADSGTGRGVTTSRETLAKRAGMSDRHAGTARAVLEQLGASVTIVRGRELSPDERSQAYATHGGRQSSAASVRALTMPASSAEAHTATPGGSQGTGTPSSVDTFHLPRRGEVKTTSYLSENSSKRGKPRKTAAPRPKPKKTSPTRPHRPPLDLETQRFVWAIAQRFLLTDGPSPRPGAPVRPGVLRGGRHIGNLTRILERHGITPRRYTPQSLADTLQRLIQAGKMRSPRFEDIRDPLAHFAWTLKRMNELVDGETTLERIRRESEERAARATEREASAHRTVIEMEAAQQAAAAFFTEFRKNRLPEPSKRGDDVSMLVHSVIGQAQLYSTPPHVQQLVGALTRLHKHLTSSGWAFTVTDDGSAWIDGDSQIQVAVAGALPHPDIVTKTTGTIDSQVVALLESLHDTP